MNWPLYLVELQPENGSDCRGTDGGCPVCNISYSGGGEIDRCRVSTTGPCVYEQVGYEEDPAYVLQDLPCERCRYCGRERTTYQFESIFHWSGTH